jgi:methionyl-tRNA formyltransferase
MAGRRLLLLGSHPAAGRGAPGEVIAIDGAGVTVACGAGALCVTKVKPEGRGELAAAEWARGARLSVGGRLESGKEFVS